jgi:putative transposase
MQEYSLTVYYALMPRFRRIENFDRIFFVTTNVRPNVRPFNENERDIALEVLASARETSRYALAGYVVMPDHLHLLLVPGHAGLSTDMQRIKRWTQHEIGRVRENTSPLWQPRYFDDIIRRVRDFWEKLEYIHNNPVAAGFVAVPSEWRWSSYGAFRKDSSPMVPVNNLGLPTRGAALLWPARYKRPNE